MVDEKILNRIKKCLALSESPEPAEAAAALRQAQKLMAIHGIDQAAIERAGLGDAKVSSKVSVSRVKDWELGLMRLVAKSFGCKLMWTSSRSTNGDVYGRYTLIGLKTQAQLAQYAAEVLLRKLIKGRMQFVSTLPQELSRKDKTMQADGFCHGWVKSIAKTVHEFAMGEQLERLIDERIAEECAGRKAKPQERAFGKFGYLAGREAGERESIQRPMESGAPSLQIGHNS